MDKILLHWSFCPLAVSYGRNLDDFLNLCSRWSGEEYFFFADNIIHLDMLSKDENVLLMTVIEE